VFPPPTFPSPDPIIGRPGERPVVLHARACAAMPGRNVARSRAKRRVVMFSATGFARPPHLPRESCRPRRQF